MNTLREKQFIFQNDVGRTALGYFHLPMPSLAFHNVLTICKLGKCTENAIRIFQWIFIASCRLTQNKAHSINRLTYKAWVQSMVRSTGKTCDLLSSNRRSLYEQKHWNSILGKFTWHNHNLRVKSLFILIVIWWMLTVVIAYFELIIF